jgi:alkaline phosphatase D
MKEAIIWLQTNKNATVKIEYFAIDNPTAIFVSDNYLTSKEIGYTYHIILDKLQPGKKYNYTVFIDAKKVVLPYETSFSSKKLWQWREDAPDFTVAFGSCNYVNEPEFDRLGKGIW